MRLSVLVVDNSPVMRNVIISALTAMNIHPDNIISADTGEQAIDLVKEKTFSILMVSWKLPDMLGLDIIRAIRAEGVNAPILMVTNAGGRDDVLSAFEAGANQYLVKPFNSNDLRAKIELLLIQSCET
ncbi:MAG: response regulator [Vampirovibrionales bacterium]|nr:response regulator [Vampirovibrionales bacterium]